MSTDLHPMFRFWHIEGDPRCDGPRADVFEGPSKTQVSKCPGCGRVLQGSTSEGACCHAVGNRVKQWPDLLLGFRFVVGPRILSDLLENGVRGFIAHPLRIHKIDSPKLRKVPTPDYFLMELTGRVNVDRQWYDEGDGNLCDVCHVWTPRPGGKHKWGGRMYFPVLDTWDGSDLLTYGNVITGFHLCTPRIVEMARAKKWTGVAFHSMTERAYYVDLAADDWLAKVEAGVRQEYPQLFRA